MLKNDSNSGHFNKQKKMKTNQMILWDQIVEFFSKLFGTESWPPRWYCGRWTDFHGWLYIVSDLMVWAAYMIIPFFLIVLITKRKGIPFPLVFYLFGAFILLCGLTHLLDASMFWWPAYRFAGLIKLLTGIVSWFTVYALFKLWPQIVGLKTGKEFNAEFEQRKIAEQKLNDYTRILEFKNTQLVDFCNIVSHNLRAPMVNIGMLVDYLEQSNDKAERKELLTKIKPVVNHLNEVFNELVESVQVRQDFEIKSDKIILTDCLNENLQGFQSQIKLYEAEIEINFNDAPIIYFPKKYIDSIFTNLISNSLKYKSPDRKPVIKIKTEKTSSGIVLSISDNGLGIDMNYAKDKLFKIRKTFHKHPDAKGFGLFMTKTQMEAMGGKIWAESAPDKGCTFFVEFINQNI